MHYDTFGRTKKIIGPNDTEASPSVEYIYDLSIKPSKITTVTKVDEGRTAVSYAFMDGLGRAIEVKTEAEDDGKQLVSGVVRYDPRGQVKEKYLSYLATASSDYVPPNYEQLKVIYEYDPVGRVIETKRPDGASSFVQYEGWRGTAIDENSHKTTSEKDAFGRLIKVTEYNAAEEYLTRYQYDTLGNLTKTIDAKANETVITYDSLGRKIAMNDPDMGHWTYDYDALGNLKKQTDAKGQVVEFQYDNINRLTGKLTNGQTTVTYAYDTATPQNPYAKGRLSKVTDSSGITEFFYDNLGREIKTVKSLREADAGGEAVPYTVSRTYDSIDRLKTVTYPDSEAVTYTYNKAGGVETVSSPGKTYVTNVNYNENGQMKRVDYGNGTRTDYSYNTQTLRLENLSTVDSQQSIVQNLSYAFDNVGNVKSITDASFGGTNTQTFEYDALSRLTKAAGENYGTINYKYDSIGNMLQNGNITMEYDQNGAGPHAVTSHDNGNRRLNVGYDPNGNMLSKETSSGVRQFTYDIENRLTEVQSPKEEYVSNYEIPLKPGWNFISLPVIVTEDISAILAYSGITKAQVSRYNPETQVWENFAYEQGKNLSQYNKFTTFDYGRGYEIYVDNACAIKITGATPQSQRTLDLKAGWNLIGAPTTSSIDAAKALEGVEYLSLRGASPKAGDEAISYNNVSILTAGSSCFIKVSSDQTWNIPREQEVTIYAYDGDGGRVKQSTVHSPQSIDETIYIGSLYESRTANDESRITKHIFLGSTRICSVDHGPSTVDYHYYHQDHIGSSNVITDESGKVAKLMEYSPYGLTTREEGAYNTNYRFTGKLFDTSTALYYYGARYYDPELGRFIQPDTIVPYPDDPQSFNRYSYCRNNPITYIDPTGHAFWDSFKKWIGNIVGAVAGIAATIMSGGNVLAGFQVYSFASGMINAGIGAFSGDWSGVGAGIGGMVGSVFGWQAGVAGGALLSNAVPKFVVGAAVGAMEFGSSGFGAGFGGAIGGGSSFKDAVTSGLVIGGVSAIAGAIMEGSYMAGWQSILHGATVEDIAAEKAQRWGPKFLEERVPPYGNYGGPGHGDPTYKKEPIDQMDAYFMNHDKMWTRGRANIADKVLSVQLQKLPKDPNQWKPFAPNVNEAIRYRTWAERCFKFI